MKTARKTTADGTKAEAVKVMVDKDPETLSTMEDFIRVNEETLGADDLLELSMLPVRGTMLLGFCMVERVA
jgi:hypothetical protein